MFFQRIAVWIAVCASCATAGCTDLPSKHQVQDSGTMSTAQNKTDAEMQVPVQNAIPETKPGGEGAISVYEAKTASAYAELPRLQPDRVPKHRSSCQNWGAFMWPCRSKALHPLS